MARSRKVAPVLAPAAPHATTRPAIRLQAQTLSIALSVGAIAVASGVSLAFEVLLTRLFSLLFEYHYVFVATSVAIAGLGIGAAIGALQKEKSQPQRILLWLALAFALDSLLLAHLPWAGTVLIHAIFALPPFILVGLFVSSFFARRSEKSGLLYAADLTGAAVGTVAVLPLISAVGAFVAIQWLALIIALAAVLLAATMQDRRSMTFGGAVLLLAVVLLAAQSVWNILTLQPASIQDAPPDKTMIRILRDPSQQAHVAETVWGPFARLDLVETRDPSQKLVFTDGGAGSYMLQFDGNLDHVANLRNSVEYLPFIAGSNDDTLILGAGAGKDVLLALLAKSKQVTAVEINPDMVALTRRYAAYNGNIFDRPGVTTVVSDGRSFVERSNKQYDLIYMNVVYSQAAGQEGSALSESYIFTEEAMRAYWQHLKPGGRIGIVTHNAFEGSRAMLTAIAAMSDEGLEMRSALDRVTLTMYASDDPTTNTSVLLITRNAVDNQMVSNVGQQAQARGMQPVYFPHYFELALRDLVQGKAGIYDFARNGDYNLVPTSDDQPYFYNLNWGLPGPLQGLLISTVIAVLLYFVLSSFMSSQSGRFTIMSLSFYFVLLGIAFMLVMIPLVQRFFLLLGNPTLALVVTLEGLLIGAGIGSFISSRRTTQLHRLVGIAVIGLIVLLLAHIFFYQWVLAHLLATDLPVRIAGCLAMVFPVGLLIGIPFPTGMRIAGKLAPSSVSLLWGLNALAAVLGAVLATTISISFGFHIDLIVAVLLYALAALSLFAVTRRSALA